MQLELAVGLFILNSEILAEKKTVCPTLACQRLIVFKQAPLLQTQSLIEVKGLPNAQDRAQETPANAGPTKFEFQHDCKLRCTGAFLICEV